MMGSLFQRLRLRCQSYDIYERHSVVSRLLAGHFGRGARSVTVLDVGGRRGLLSDHAGFKVTALNVDGSGDLLYEGRALPMPDRSSAAVVTIDTLEHIPGLEREGFLRECARVAAQCVIVAAPFGSPQHAAEERRLDERYRETHGAYMAYLHEHVVNGLPTLDEIRAWQALFPAAAHRLLFAGDFLWQGRAFERRMCESSPQSGWEGLRLSGLFHPLRLSDKPLPRTNRFYWMMTFGAPP